jgi:hypothetical protein
LFQQRTFIANLRTIIKRRKRGQFLAPEHIPEEQLARISICRLKAITKAVPRPSIPSRGMFLPIENRSISTPTGRTTPMHPPHLSLPLFPSLLLSHTQPSPPSQIAKITSPRKTATVPPATNNNTRSSPTAARLPSNSKCTTARRRAGTSSRRRRRGRRRIGGVWLRGKSLHSSYSGSFRRDFAELLGG